MVSSNLPISINLDDKKQCEQFHSDIMRKFVATKRKANSKDLEKEADPQPKRTFSRKLTMDEQEEDMFKGW